MAKKKLKNYTWLIVAAIVVLAVIVLSSGGEGGALAKYYAPAKIMPVPAPTAFKSCDFIGAKALESYIGLTGSDVCKSLGYTMCGGEFLMQSTSYYTSANGNCTASTWRDYPLQPISTIPEGCGAQIVKGDQCTTIGSGSSAVDERKLSSTGLFCCKA